MSLDAPKTVTEVFAAHGLMSGQVCVLLECQELALAVTLQKKYRVAFTTGPLGVECASWPEGTAPKNNPAFRWFMTGTDLADIRLVRDHLRALLLDSANTGGAAQ
ncbi:hypothetical protein ACGLWX_09510 [Halomonas sp. HMF6819]|uniref:hypothetical protein n=1 Tax=Halomonas sp. HMF6819 TaxID=3373085 RepID=UPI0037B80FAE